MKRYLPLIVLIVLAALVGGAIMLMGGDDEPVEQAASQTANAPSPNTAETNETPSPQPVATTTDEVEMENSAFTPADITVKKGTTVTWTNKDNTLHNVIADSGSGPNSPNMQEGEIYSFTFNTAGEFTYQCTFHPGMVGKVTVTE